MKNIKRKKQKIWYKMLEILSQKPSLSNKHIYKNTLSKNKKYVYGKNFINESKWKFAPSKKRFIKKIKEKIIKTILDAFNLFIFISFLSLNFSINISFNHILDFSKIKNILNIDLIHNIYKWV